MNYYYDVLLNFLDTNIYFYEWDNLDNIEYYKRVPLVQVNSKTLRDFINNNIVIEKEFLDAIKGKAKKKDDCPSYIAIFADKNGYTKNTLKHTTGIISMARATAPDSAGSQFFIVLADSQMVSQSLDNKYAAFGKVIEGMDTIKNIEDTAEIENEMTGQLKENITIESVTVNTYGQDFKVIKNDNN